MRSSKRNTPCQKQKVHKHRGARRNDHSFKTLKDVRQRARKGHQQKHNKSFSQAQLFEIEVAAFKRLCKAVNTPYSNEMLQKVDAGDWLGIANAPFPDTDSPDFPDNYLIQQVMRKNPRMPGNRPQKSRDR